MRKNGFTLIELLAVIVILAIIALIATPIVLNIIDETKDNAKLRSAEFYMDAVEQTIMRENMNRGGSFKFNVCRINGQGNLICDEDESNEIKVEVSGEKPTSGTIEFDNGTIKRGSLFISGDTFIADSNGNISIKKDNAVIFTLANDETAEEDNMYVYLVDQCIDLSDYSDDYSYKMSISDINNNNKIFNVVLSKLESAEFKVVLLANTHESFIYADYNQPTEKICAFTFYGKNYKDLEGLHEVKIEKVEEASFEVLRVDRYGVDIISKKIKEGPVSIEVIDSDGNVLTYEDNAEDAGVNNTVTELNNDQYYGLIQNGKTITVKVTQGDNVYTFGGEEFTYKDFISDMLTGACVISEDYYYWGNDYTVIHMAGC